MSRACRQVAVAACCLAAVLATSCSSSTSPESPSGALSTSGNPGQAPGTGVVETGGHDGPGETYRGPRTYQHNRALAAAESARVVGTTPVPAGSTRLITPPRSWSGPSDQTLGPSDGSLTRTAWWTVPAGTTADDIQRQLLAQAPDGMSREAGVGEGSNGIRDVTYLQPAPPDPMDYTAVSLLVQWGPAKTQDGKLLVRADTFLAARDVRNPRTVLPGRTLAVNIDEVRARGNGRSHRMPAVHFARDANPQTLKALVAEVNGLYASTKPIPALPCPAPMRPVPRLKLTFLVSPVTHEPPHVITMRLQAWCMGQVRVNVDGHGVSPSLDPDDLVDFVDHLVDTQHPAPGSVGLE